MTFDPARLPTGLRELYDYWASKCHEGRLPRRVDLDPMDTPHLLPRLCLIDVVSAPSGKDYRYRLIGTEVVNRMGRDYTGFSFAEFLAVEHRAAVYAVYDEVVNEGVPSFSHYSVPISGKEHISYGRLLLPLASDGRTVDIVLAGFDFS